MLLFSRFPFGRDRVFIVIFDTPALQARGLQHMPSIPADVLYVFPLVAPGLSFHSRNVPEPFDIAFLAEDFTVLDIALVVPPRGGATAPKRSAMAVEARAGTLRKAGFVVGRKASF